MLNKMLVGAAAVRAAAGVTNSRFLAVARLAGDRRERRLPRTNERTLAFAHIGSTKCNAKCQIAILR